MRAMLAVAWMVMVAAVSVLAEEEWPLRLEGIWETPGKDEPVFAEGFPPAEIKAVLADTSLPQEDKDWLLNQIRHWAAYRTKKLWLDDGTTMDIPAVKPGDRVRSFTVYASRNMKYWLVRAMRIEGPEVPPEPAPPPGGVVTPEFGAAKDARLNAQWQQKAHWREVFMDVTGRIYWEKEFGPYDTYLEDEWYGEVGAYISDDGEVVVKRARGPRGWLCNKGGNCVEGREYGRAILSEDGSTIVVHSGPRSSGLTAYDSSGQVRWRSERIEGEVLSPTVGGFVIGVSDGGRASVFSTATSDSGMPPRWVVCLLGADGRTVRKWEVAEEPAGTAFAEEGSKLLLLTSSSLAMIDTHGGNELWRYRADRRLERLLATEDGMTVVCSRDGEMLVLGRGGDLLHRSSRARNQSFLSPNGAILLEKSGWLRFSKLELTE